MKPLLLMLLAGASALAETRWVAVPAGSYTTATNTVRLDAFEMTDAPVTNLEYAVFVRATGRTPPQYFTGKTPPAALTNHPVVYVSRYDADAYCRWLTSTLRRIHRLPTAAEFEYVQRAGRNSTYPWGDEDPASRANYDSSGTRSYPQWREFLKPVRSYPANQWGFYDLAGNVWQLIDTNSDPFDPGYNFRLLSPVELGRAIVGGSWARASQYLRIGVRASASPGVLHPDIGFRVAREAAGSSSFHLTVRRVVALPQGPGRVFISWQSLPDDPRSFHVYRSARRDAAGDRITAQPISDRTNFIDENAPSSARRIFYRVRPLQADGSEGAPSEWSGVSTGTATGLIATYEPLTHGAGMEAVFADLDGDGRPDVIVRIDNGIQERARDPGVPVELEAFNSYGKSLWRRPLADYNHCYGNAHNVPVIAYDLDGDGRAEVIVRLQEGDNVYLAILDGLTGNVIRKTKWTGMVSDHARTSTRLHLAIAYLDGKHPAIINQTGLYENEVLEAYDVDLQRLWRFESFGPTNGSGSHRIEVADVDGDGRDEVFDGSTLLNPDGKVRWSIYREHADQVSVKHILPNSPDRQVFYAIESNPHAGAYVVDAKTGREIWKMNREQDPRWEHAHIGWLSDIWDGSPGMEMLTNRDGHDALDQVLFSATGRIIMNPFPPGWRPINWTGGKVRDLVSTDGSQIGRFTGSGVDVVRSLPRSEMKSGACPISADLYGDYRDELICVGVNQAGKPAIFIYTNTEPVARKEVTRTANHEYRLWLARNWGGGYPIYFEWEP